MALILKLSYRYNIPKKIYNKFIKLERWQKRRPNRITDKKRKYSVAVAVLGPS